MNGIGTFLNLIKKEEKPTGSDYTATVTRVDGKTAYVQITGAEITDTPVSMTIDAKAGDSVRIRVNSGKAWITGNDTRPPTNNTTEMQTVVKGNATNKKQINTLTEESRNLKARIKALETVTGEYETWTSTEFSNASGEVFAVKMGHIVWVHGYHSLNNGVEWPTTIMTLPWAPIQTVSVSTQNDASGAYYSGYFDVQTDGRMTVGTPWSGYTRYSFVYITN